MPARKPRSPRSTARSTIARNTPSWQDASAFAARKHRFQLRKDQRTPYYSHVARVAMTLVCVFGCDDPVAIAAAFLHDTIEDTTTDFEDIADRFGPEVAECVAALTKNMALPEKLREAEYDARIARADWRVKLVKLADAYDNMCDVDTYPSDEKAEGVRKGVERIRRAVRLARGHAPRVEILTRAAGIAAKLLRGGR